MSGASTYLAYNRDHFRRVGLDPNRPPSNREEFLTALEKLRPLTNPEQGTYPYGVTGSWAWRWLGYMYQFGGDLLTADFRQPAFQQAGVQAIRFFMELVDRGLMPNRPIESVPLFATGQTSMADFGVWTVGTLTEALGENFGAGPVPIVGSTRAVFGGSHVMAMPAVMVRDPRVLEAAMTWIKYLWDNALDWYAAGQTPARLSIAQSAELAERLPRIAAIARQIPYVRQWPFVAISSEVVAEIQVYLDQVLVNWDTSPEDAMAAAADAVQLILDDFWASR